MKRTVDPRQGAMQMSGLALFYEEQTDSCIWRDLNAFPGLNSTPDPSRYGAKDAHVPLDMARDRRDDLDFYFVTEVKIVAE